MSSSEYSSDDDYSYTSSPSPPAVWVPQLPDELLLLIIRHVFDAYDPWDSNEHSRRQFELARWCSVSKRIAALAQPLLWEVVHFPLQLDPPYARPLDRLARCTRTFKASIAHHDDAALSDRLTGMQRVLNFVAGLPNLRMMSLNGFEDVDGGLVLDLSALGRACPGLRTLEVSFCDLATHTSSLTSPSAVAFPSLETLSLSFRGPLSIDLERNLPLVDVPALRTLTLHCETYPTLPDELVPQLDVLQLQHHGGGAIPDAYFSPRTPLLMSCNDYATRHIFDTPSIEYVDLGLSYGVLHPGSDDTIILELVALKLATLPRLRALFLPAVLSPDPVVRSTVRDNYFPDAHTRLAPERDALLALCAKQRVDVRWSSGWGREKGVLPAFAEYLREMKGRRKEGQ